MPQRSIPFIGRDDALTRLGSTLARAAAGEGSIVTAGSGPVGITLGADEAVWFTEIGAGQVGRITAAGQITEYPLPDRSARPHAIIADPSDGGCWFTEWAANCIGRITPAGQVEEYVLPTPSSEPHGLPRGTDGAIYAALEIGSIARLDAPGKTEL